MLPEMPHISSIKAHGEMKLWSLPRTVPFPVPVFFFFFPLWTMRAQGRSPKPSMPPTFLLSAFDILDAFKSAQTSYTSSAMSLP